MRIIKLLYFFILFFLRIETKTTIDTEIFFPSPVKLRNDFREQWWVRLEEKEKKIDNWIRKFSSHSTLNAMCVCLCFEGGNRSKKVALKKNGKKRNANTNNHPPPRSLSKCLKKRERKAAKYKEEIKPQTFGNGAINFCKQSVELKEV